MTTTTATKLFPCARCDGKGRIWAYNRVLGGVCFKCAGSGKQATKPRKSAKWAVLDTAGERCCYVVKAPSAERAIARALVTFAGASEAYRAEHDMSAPVAVPYDDWFTPERIEAMQR